MQDMNSWQLFNTILSPHLTHIPVIQLSNWEKCLQNETTTLAAGQIHTYTNTQTMQHIHLQR